jgi:hypothetical protein
MEATTMSESDTTVVTEAIWASLPRSVSAVGLSGRQRDGHQRD